MAAQQVLSLYSDGRGAIGHKQDEGIGAAFLEVIPHGKEGMELTAEGRGRGRELGTLGQQ